MKFSSCVQQCSSPCGHGGLGLTPSPIPDPERRPTPGEIPNPRRPTPMGHPPAKVFTCDVCEMHRAILYCDADEAYLCSGCDASVHGANTLASRHKRVSIEEEPEDDGVCPGESTTLPSFHQFKASPLDFPLGGIRIGDITYARVSQAGNPGNSPLPRREDEDAHQVPRFVPVAQELPSLEPFRFYALATSGSPPSQATRFMSLLEGEGEREGDAPEPERGDEEAAQENNQELGVVPDMASSRGGDSMIKGPKADKEREARVNRYREKRRTRMFSKKIRYEVRKIYAENRPRLKGRFVRRTSDMDSLQCMWSEDK